MTRRWCKSHARDFKEHDFATPKGPRAFPEESTLAWKVLLRTNYLLELLDPDDNVAFQEICSEFNTPRVGEPMDPHGAVICLLANTIKCPPAIRFFQRSLREDVATGGPNAKSIVNAFYETVRWADGKPFTEMHAILSVAGRAHAVSGLDVSAGQLGILSGYKPEGCQPTAIKLGPAGKTY